MIPPAFLVILDFLSSTSLISVSDCCGSFSPSKTIYSPFSSPIYLRSVLHNISPSFFILKPIDSGGEVCHAPAAHTCPSSSTYQKQTFLSHQQCLNPQIKIDLTCLCELNYSSQTVTDFFGAFGASPFLQLLAWPSSG